MDYNFKALGKRVNAPSKELDTFPKPQHVTVVLFTSDELTTFCPVTKNSKPSSTISRGMRRSKT